MLNFPNNVQLKNLIKYENNHPVTLIFARLSKHFFLKIFWFAPNFKYFQPILTRNPLPRYLIASLLPFYGTSSFHSSGSSKSAPALRDVVAEFTPQGGARQNPNILLYSRVCLKYTKLCGSYNKPSCGYQKCCLRLFLLWIGITNGVLQPSIPRSSGTIPHPLQRYSFVYTEGGCCFNAEG